MSHPSIRLLLATSLFAAACGGDDAGAPDGGLVDLPPVEVLVGYTPRGGAFTPVAQADVVVTRLDGNNVTTTTDAAGAASVRVAPGEALTVLYPDVAHAFTVLDVEPGEALRFDEPRHGAARDVTFVMPELAGLAPTFTVYLPCTSLDVPAGQSPWTISVPAPCASPMDVAVEAYDPGNGAYYGYGFAAGVEWTEGGQIDLRGVTLSSSDVTHPISVSPVAAPGTANITVLGRHGTVPYGAGWEQASLANGATRQVPLPAGVTPESVKVELFGDATTLRVDAPLVDGRAAIVPLPAITEVVLEATSVRVAVASNDGDAMVARLWDGGGTYNWAIVGAPARQALVIPGLRPFGAAPPTQGYVQVLDHPEADGWDAVRATPTLVDVVYEPHPSVGLRISDRTVPLR